MRIIEEDHRAKKLRVQLESSEDLYFASLLIDEGDFVTAWTTRQTRVERASGSEKGERVRVKLTVQVKKIEFQRFSDSLRVLGIITDAPEWLSARGSHHTIGLRPGDEVEIVKTSLLRHHERILRVAALTTRLAGVVSVDVDEVAVAILRPQGLEILTTIDLPRYSKEGSLKEHLKAHLSKLLPQLVASLKSKGVEDLLLVAPGLVLEVLADIGVPASRLIEVSEGGLAGLYELLRRDSLRDFLEENAIFTSKRLLSELIDRLHRSPSKVALGSSEVLKALDARAVEALLILDEALLSEDRCKVLAILERASDTVRNVVVVPPGLEGAELLRSIGGVAALLYFSTDRG